ncbi:MAG: GYDIA family GHMP kinase [Bacteroidota bacterium]
MAIFTEQSYRARGKLLLTGEYFVLDGALSLALPTRLGQQLHLRPHTDRGSLHWRSENPDGSPWFQGHFDLGDGQILQASDQPTAQRLRQILQAIRRQNPGFLSPGQGVLATSRLEFPRHWGLGSSSTLIATLAQWAGVDPYQLLADTFGGSGYDIACATATGPIYYQRTTTGPQSRASPFDPPFREHLFWVYLEQKQNSREGIARYRAMVEKKTPLIDKISAWSREIPNCESLDDFAALLDAHEALVAEALRLEPVKKSRFADFWGSVKSLGAWGGDFVLLTSDRTREETQRYCNEKGFTTFFSYDELLL